MADGNSKDSRDLVLAPNEFAYILDETKGNIQVYVGPHKSSPAGTDAPVQFNEITKRFEKCGLEASKQKWIAAPEGWYIILKNPSNDVARNHPRAGTIEGLPDLGVGRKINIRGPITFPLWPGQMCRVIQGHHLRSNQYLTVRVYDEVAAKENWATAVMKTREGEDAAKLPMLPDLAIGKQLTIKGTDVSFYIPPTGVEVIADNGYYVREAVTLENLEYCILLDEDGNKVFRYGPDVVFPEPTQSFVQKEGLRKFRDPELNKLSGIYVKVIKEYTESNGTVRKVGDELWITGEDQPIYYPRAEHAVIKYGDQTIHYAVAIPKGEGRYVLDRDLGDINLVRGSKMLLLDPRQYAFVRRLLSEKIVKLWFPGNTDAVEYNRQLGEVITRSSGGKSAVDFLTEDAYRNSAVKDAANKAQKAFEGSVTMSGSVMGDWNASGYEVHSATDNVVGEDFNRKQKFTPPRTLVLDSKYDGAVSIDVWTGYAVLVKSATGQRKVVVGPDRVLLEYDETLETFELSKGTPKSSDNTVRDVYLRVKNNKISDRILVETRDMCEINLHLKYRVNFEGEPEKWFDVENYVQFLVDHMRSMLKGVVRTHDVKTFYSNPVAIVRDAILGTAVGGAHRPGRAFEENGMRVYDVEVLAVDLQDAGIEESLLQAQQAAIKNAIFITNKELELERTAKVETLQRAIDDEKSTTVLSRLKLEETEMLAKHTLEQNRAAADHEEVMFGQINDEEEMMARLANDQKREETLVDINRIRLMHMEETEASNLKVQQDKDAARLANEKSKADLHIAMVQADVAAVREKMAAMTPGIAEALSVLGDKDLAQKIAEAMSWSRMVGGANPADLLTSLLSGTKIQDVVKKLTS